MIAVSWAVFRVARQSDLFVFGLACAVDADSSGDFVIFVQRDAAERSRLSRYQRLSGIATRQLRKLQAEQMALVQC